MGTEQHATNTPLFADRHTFRFILIVPGKEKYCCPTKVFCFQNNQGWHFSRGISPIGYFYRTSLCFCIMWISISPILCFFYKIAIIFIFFFSIFFAQTNIILTLHNIKSGGKEPQQALYFYWFTLGKSENKGFCPHIVGVSHTMCAARCWMSVTLFGIVYKHLPVGRSVACFHVRQEESPGSTGHSAS